MDEDEVFTEPDTPIHEGDKKKFEPSKYFRDLKGKKYLDVKWRLVWLRSEHPDATIETALVKIFENKDGTPVMAVFKATVTLPTGGSATAYGSESTKDFGDFVEKAETKAVGRALANLGFGTQFAGEDGEFAEPNDNYSRSGSSSGYSNGSRSSYSSRR